MASAVQLERDGELRLVGDLVVQMFEAVVEGVAAVTEALLAGDCELAHQVVTADRRIGARRDQLEALVERRLLDRPARHPGEVRFLVSLLRIAPELERSGDVIAHIARTVPQGLAGGLTGRARGLLHAMGASAEAMWRNAMDAFTDVDPASLDDLRELEENLDDLHVELTVELCQRALPVSAAFELALIAHAYERLGDHAVNVSGRCAQASWN